MMTDAQIQKANPCMLGVASAWANAALASPLAPSAGGRPLRSKSTQPDLCEWRCFLGKAAAPHGPLLPPGFLKAAIPFSTKIGDPPEFVRDRTEG